MTNEKLQDQQHKLKYSILNIGRGEVGKGEEKQVKNEFTLSDYSWFNNDESEQVNIAGDISFEATLTTLNDQTTTSYFNDILIKNTPYIRLTEFQPNNTLTYNIKLLTEIYNLSKSFFSGGSLQDFMDRISAMFGGITLDKFSDILIDNLIKSVSASGAQKTPDGGNPILDIPYAFYKLLISGKYTGRYDIPFYNNSTYLHNKSSQDGWKSNTLRGSLFGDFEETLKNIPGLNTIDMAGKPKWSLENGGPAYDTFSCEFYLYNNTYDALVSNFIFINTLLPNSMWLQNGLLQHPAALYDVEIPGRTQLMFCKANLVAEFVGKVRRPPDAFYDDLNILIFSDSALAKKYGQTLNRNAVYDVPDAYKIKIDFTSMLPNNFNTYLYYMISENDLVIGGANADINKALLDATVATFDDIRNTVPDYETNREA